MARTKENKKSKFVDMQNVLFQTLERLNDEDKIKENPSVEIKRCATIAKASSAVINSVRTNMEIMKLADKKSISVDELNDTLGLSVEK